MTDDQKQSLAALDGGRGFDRAEQSGGATPGDSDGMPRLSTRAGWVVVLGAIVIGTLALGPSVTSHYGRLDDFAWAFDNAAGGASTHIQAWVNSGRLLPAIVAAALGDIPGSVSDLVLLRGIATLMLSVGAGLIGLLVLRLQPTRTHAATVLAILVAAFVLSLPSIPAISTWAVLAGSSAAFPLALGAGWIATLARLPLFPWWVWSPLLILAAAFTYQHVAPIAVLPVLLWQAAQFARGRALQLRRIAIVAASVVVSLFANAVYLRAVGSTSLNRVEGYSLTERAQWFVTEYLPRTVDLAVPWSHQSALLSSFLLLFFLLAPLVIGLRALMLSVAVILSWLFTAAFVLPTELWASYRLISAAQVVLWGGSAVVLAMSILALSRQMVRNALAGLAAVTALCAVSLSGVRAYVYFAEPNAADWAAVVCALRQDRNPMDLRLNPYTATTSPLLAYDEYGMIGSSVDWVLPYMVALAEHENAPREKVEEGRPQDFTILPAVPNQPGFGAANACVG